MPYKSRPKSWYIQLIHIAKTSLKLDDDLYRSNLQLVTRKDSCKDMTTPELVTVLEHFKKLGFKPKASKTNKNSPESRTKPKKDMLDKLRQIWIEMANQGLINDGSELALETWATRQATRLNNGEPIKKLQWLSNQMRYQLIEQLKQWHARLLKQQYQIACDEACQLFSMLSDADKGELTKHLERVNNAPNTHSVLSNAFKFYQSIIRQYK